MSVFGRHALTSVAVKSLLPNFPNERLTDDPERDQKELLLEMIACFARLRWHIVRLAGSSESIH